jgi:hypothetical protein
MGTSDKSVCESGRCCGFVCKIVVFNLRMSSLRWRGTRADGVVLPRFCRVQRRV